MKRLHVLALLVAGVIAVGCSTGTDLTNTSSDNSTAAASVEPSADASSVEPAANSTETARTDTETETQDSADMVLVSLKLPGMT